MHSLEDLRSMSVQWAKDRQIIPNSNPSTQLLKGLSELGELADATIKGDRAKIEDGVGDVLVVLSIYCELQGVDMNRCFQAAYNEIKDRRGTLLPNGTFVKES